MARVKLTQGRVTGFDCPQGKGQAFLWDSEVPGLAVRATKSAQAFVWQGKLRGRDIRITLGPCASWSLDDARQHSRELQRMVDVGKDPRDLEAQRSREARCEAGSRGRCQEGARGSRQMDTAQAVRGVQRAFGGPWKGALGGRCAQSVPLPCSR